MNRNEATKKVIHWRSVGMRGIFADFTDLGRMIRAT